jgi:hypothetical protein
LMMASINLALDGGEKYYKNTIVLTISASIPKTQLPRHDC